MAASLVRGADREVAIGRIFERSFATIGHNLAVTIGLALLFGAIPSALMTWGVSYLQRTDFRDYSAAFMAGLYAAMLTSWIMGLAINALVQGVLTQATLAESEGRKASIGESLRSALPVILPLIGLSILLALGVAAGFILLIVPGVMLYLAWSVAAPALVAERQGIRAAFRRSWELTRGSRWKIFAMILILYILYYLFSGVVSLVSIWLLGARSLSGFGQDLSVGFMIMNLVVGLVVNLLWGSAQASLYVELRDAKDGPSTSNLEEVFA